MTEIKDDAAWAAKVIISKATDEELRRLKKMSDNDLLRSSQSLDAFAIAESMRRLKEALHKEERAIKRLTYVLVFLTVILVLVGIEAVWRR